MFRWTVPSNEIKTSACNSPTISQTQQQHEQIPVMNPLTCQSPSRPQVTRHYSSVIHGLYGSPVAVKLNLGWTLQGRISNFQPQNCSVNAQCLFTTSSSPANVIATDHFTCVQWKTVIRWKQDQQALKLLEQVTERVQINGVNHYAIPVLNVPLSAVMSRLWNTESWLAKDPKQCHTTIRSWS